jgi:hypothetical protein
MHGKNLSLLVLLFVHGSRGINAAERPPLLVHVAARFGKKMRVCAVVLLFPKNKTHVSRSLHWKEICACIYIYILTHESRCFHTSTLLLFSAPVLERI